MYDAIVVGARCAGSPTAMLLARKGYRVLLLDRASFPERHALHPLHPLSRASRGCSGGACSTGSWPRAARPSRQLIFDLGPFPLTGDRTPADGVTEGYAPAPHGPRRHPRRGGRRGRGRAARALHCATSCSLDDGRVTGIRGRTARRRDGRPSARGSSSARTACTRWSHARSAPAYDAGPR